MNRSPSTSPSYPAATSFEVSRLLREIDSDCAAVQASLSLTANENVMSRMASSLLSTPLESRYHLGDEAGVGPLASKGGLFYRRLTGIVALESAAREASKEMLQASFVDFRPLSGVHAMMTTILSLTEPGDTVYSFSPDVGGHFATSNILKRAGRRSRFLPWDRNRLDIDLSLLARDLKKNGRPALVFLDQGITLFPLSLRGLREVLGPRVLVVYDGSHALGLIFGGEFQSPLDEGCDVLQGNTHKSFPGPQKAMIAFRDAGVGRTVSRAMDEGLVSSQHTHHSAALCLTVLEMKSHGRAYARQMFRNAEALATGLRAQGLGLLSRDGAFTRSHVILVDACGRVPARTACERLMRAGISTNARPFQEREVLRFGVQELTRRGMGETEMAEIARLIGRLLLRDENEATIKRSITELRRSFGEIHFSFDLDAKRRPMILQN